MNFVYNLVNTQIDHIEHHEPVLTELLSTNEVAQEDYILLQNLREAAETLTNLFGNTLSTLSVEESESLSKPAMKLEFFFQNIFHVISCGGHNEN
jgi:hypothetical protein